MEPDRTGAQAKDRASRGGARPEAGLAAGFAVLLLILTTSSQGAFAVNRWAPLALFALALLITALVTRGIVVPNVAARVSLAGIWGLAAWSLLSMLWAGSPGDALNGGCEMVLYAAIVTLPFALPLTPRALAGVGWALAAGIGAIAVFVLVRLLSGGDSLFLAGRLNGPVNYRNATALLFALPVWPFVVATATRTFRRPVRAVCFALTALCLSLVFLTQSRGILIGLVLGGCAALSLGPDRVRRAWVSLLAVAAIVIASPWLLRPFHAFDGGAGTVSAHDITVAAVATALVTLAALVVGMAIAVFDSGLRVQSKAFLQLRRAARLALMLGVVAAAVATLAAIGNPVTYAKQKWDQFHELNAGTPTSTRYASVSGQRYDLWRVALKEFETAPLLGVGSHNYATDYYRMRRTNRNLDDPHSLVFSLLSEEGAIGVALFVLFLGGIAAIVVLGWRGLEPAARRHAVGPLATGVVLLGQSAVDWIWQIPGLTAIGLLALSVGAAQVAAAGVRGRRSAGSPAGEPSPRTRPRVLTGRLRLAGRGLAVVALLACTAGVLALFVSNAYVQRAQTLIGDPAAELSAARTAAALDPWSVTPHYLEASAEETTGHRGGAYAQLRDALTLEPENSATLGVLGDFEARGENDAAARSYYRRALALNPLDVGLQQLARFGESAHDAPQSHR